MSTDVQGWLDATLPNDGWRITSSNEGLTSNPGVQAFAKTASLAVTYNCKAAYLDTGTSCTTCTATANLACNVAAGNACNDPGPPSTTYSCACVSPYVVGTDTGGHPACVATVTDAGPGDGGATDAAADGASDAATDSGINESGATDGDAAADAGSGSGLDSGVESDGAVIGDGAIMMDSGAEASADGGMTLIDADVDGQVGDDGGSAPSGPAASADSGMTPIGADGGSAASGQNGGCGCRLAGSHAPARRGTVALVALGLVTVLRRRRSRVRP
jgi:MYXO-CTERM domain-containing protein